MIICLSGCVEKQASEVTTKSTELPSQYVLLNRSAELTDYVGQYAEALPGKTFLVINLVLENHGYSTIDINPNYFAVVIDKVAYPYDKATFSTESPLTSLALLDGGKTSGYLVFQIPEGKTGYALVYAGPEKANVIYGDLEGPEAAQKEPALKIPSRNVTFSLEGYPYSLIDYGSFAIVDPSKSGYISPGSTRVDTSKQGYVTQVTRLERNQGKDDPASFVEVNIKTFLDESLKPANKDKAIKEAADSYIDAIKKRILSNIEEKPPYDAALSNGDEVTVRQIKAMPFNYNNNLYWFSYVPDNSTIVTVASSENKQEFDEVIKTLNIGEMQNVW